jgi:hypothetical protein
MASAKKYLGLTSIPADASIFMRRYGLFVAGHLYVFSKERYIWNGGPADIDIVIVTGEPWPIFFQLKHNQ